MNTPPVLATTRKSLRQQLRARRRALPAGQQRLASAALIKQLASHPLFIRSQHIAFYQASDGEIDVRHLIRIAERRGKQCYLPVLRPFGVRKLWFGRYRSTDPLVRNYFGLAEPTPDQPHLAPWALDLVILPLVGFDRRGNRLGMGGGFYDRTFAFRKRQSTPRLLGVAHHCQEVPALSHETWDIPLDAIATDREVIAVRRSGS